MFFSIQNIINSIYNLPVIDFSILSFFLMFLEGLALPIPSEIIMPLVGYYSQNNPELFIILTFIATIGSLLGATVSYFIGLLIKKDVLLKIGKYIGLKEEYLDLFIKWYNKYGNFIVFISRLIPGFRSDIGYISGIGSLKLKEYIIYTFFGQLFFDFILGFIGYEYGKYFSEYVNKSIIYLLIFSFVIIIFYILYEIKIKNIIKDHL